MDIKDRNILIKNYETIGEPIGCKGVNNLKERLNAKNIHFNSSRNFS